MTARAAAVAAAVLACAVHDAAAQQTATFATATKTVAVYATVKDAAGRLIPDLPRSAFAVDDNGKQQELTLFESDLQPITVVLLLDRSGSMVEQFTLVEQAAEKFVEAMLPADRARIGSFSNRIQVDPRDFTSNRDELLKILRNELQEEGPTPLWNAVNVGITALLHQQGRRVILVFTDGADEPLIAGPNNSSLRSVMRRAEEENVMVYAIGLAGSRPAGGRNPHSRVVDQKPDEGLPKIAAATGGGYFQLTSTDDLGPTFKRVADELHHQYVIGFTPQALDGKMHALQVRVTDPGMTVRARRSYLATKDQ